MSHPADIDNRRRRDYFAAGLVIGVALGVALGVTMQQAAEPHGTR